MVEEIKPRDARQGRKGKQVLAVLIGGMVLALIVWIVLEIIYP